MNLKVYAPATTANFNVGFDVLGLALKPLEHRILGDMVTLSESTESDPSQLLTLCTQGPFAHELPTDPQANIVMHCWYHFEQILKSKGQHIKPLTLTLHKGLPVGSGLGSSACSVVATLYALNLFYGEPLKIETLLPLMGQLEGRISGAIHYDNVAPCYLGGLQLMIGEGEPLSVPIPCFEQWFWVLCYPGTPLSTAQARSALPSEYPLKTCLTYGRSLAGFIHACHRQDEALAVRCLHDVIAEPYRASLMPGLTDLRVYAQQSSHVLATGISGAGPTLFGLVNHRQAADEVCDWMRANLIRSSDGFTVICQLDQQGVRRMDGEIHEAI